LRPSSALSSVWVKLRLMRYRLVYGSDRRLHVRSGARLPPAFVARMRLAIRRRRRLIRLLAILVALVLPLWLFTFWR
jgi:cell division septal protein FtsQ